MASFLVTAEQEVVDAAKAALAAVENIIVTDVAPELEQGLLALLQTAAAEVAAAVGNLFTKLTGFLGVSTDNSQAGF